MTLTRECTECAGYGYRTKHALCDPRGGTERCDATGCEDGVVTIGCEAWGCREDATIRAADGEAYCDEHAKELTE